MTEADWLSCTDPDLLLEYLLGRAKRRQLADFVRACWGRVAQVPRGVLEPEIDGLNDWDAVRHAAESATQGARWALSFADERKHQAEILRRVFGNPFRPLRLPASVVALAQALATGEDVAFALHDALLDAGQADLADHFRDARCRHAPACPTLDKILGKN